MPVYQHVIQTLNKIQTFFIGFVRVSKVKSCILQPKLEKIVITVMQ